jgi:hypothetical protein
MDMSSSDQFSKKEVEILKPASRYPTLGNNGRDKGTMCDYGRQETSSEQSYRAAL